MIHECSVFQGSSRLSTYIFSPFGIAPQEKLICQELLLYTARRIESVSSHDQVFTLVSLGYIGDPIPDLGRLAQQVERLVVDTQRIVLDMNEAITNLHTID